jgi:copper chaperone CopZ
MAWWDSTPAYRQPTPTQPTPQTDGMKLDIFHHVSTPDLLGILTRLDRLQTLMTGLLHQGNKQMATTTELVALATALSAEVKKFGPAVDALEVAVTAALNSIPGGIPAEAQAEIDAAVLSLKESLTFAQSAVADAGDGVDEANQQANQP